MDLPLQTLAEYAERSYDRGNADKATIGTRNEGYRNKMIPKQHDNQQEKQ